MTEQRRRCEQRLGGRSSPLEGEMAGRLEFDIGRHPNTPCMYQLKSPVLSSCASPRRNSQKRSPLSARSEEHTSELQSLMRISYAVFCLKKKKNYIRKSDHKQ